MSQSNCRRASFNVFNVFKGDETASDENDECDVIMGVCSQYNEAKIERCHDQCCASQFQPAGDGDMGSMVLAYGNDCDMGSTGGMSYVGVSSRTWVFRTRLLWELRGRTVM